MIVIFDSERKTDLSSLNAVADCKALVTRVVTDWDLSVESFRGAVSVVTQASVCISKAQSEGVEVLVLEGVPMANLVALGCASLSTDEAELVGEVAIQMTRSWALMGHELYSLNQTPSRVPHYSDGQSAVVSLSLEQVPSTPLSEFLFITQAKADQYG